MPRFKDEEITAYHVDKEIVCRECISAYSIETGQRKTIKNYTKGE